MERLKLRNKLGYASGTLAKDFITPLWASYLLYFYTDVFGISGAAAGILLLVARIWDAVNDPLMGVFADRTKTKYGRFRPYILIVPIPLYLFTILSFTTPDLIPVGKLIWAYVTYIGSGMLFTMFDVPMWGMLATLTNDEKERNQMISFVRLISTFGFMIITFAALPLVGVLGRGNDAKGFQLLAIIICAVSFGFSLICFFSTKERYNTEKSASSLKEMLKALTINKPLAILIVCLIIVYIGMILPSSVGTYFIIYRMGLPDMVGLLLGLGSLPALFGVIAAPYLAKKMGGKKALFYSFAVAAVANLAAFFIVGNSVVMYLIFSFIIGFCTGVPNVLLASFIVDSSDYSEWKTGVRCDGTAFALQSFSIKLGQAIAGFAGGILLSATGYMAGSAVQAGSVLAGLNVVRFIAPAVITVIAVFAIRAFPINAELKDQMAKDLTERRNQS